MTNTEYTEHTEETQTARAGSLTPRTALRRRAVGAAGLAFTAARGVAGPYLSQRGLLSPDGAFAAASTAVGDAFFYIEADPTSPPNLNPFTDELPTPKALRPQPKAAFTKWAQPPGPGDGQQNSLRNQRHQKWSSDPDVHSPDPLV